MHAEQVTDPITYHGEGPCWSPSWGGLRWVDMLAGDLLALGPDGQVSRRHVGAVAAVVRPRRAGGAVIAVERGMLLEDPDGSLHALPAVWSDPEVRMNEGGCDPDGRFWVGSMAFAKTPGAGAVYRLDPDLSVREAWSGVTISNGLEWSPDGSLAYYVDTPTHRVDVFDYSAATGLTGRRPFVDLSDRQASPDGLTVDAEGGVWTALNGDGLVHRYTPDGTLSEVVEVPVAKVTACVLGGERLDQLFITTSREDLPPDAEPLAGSLYRADVGVPGRPVHAFAG